MAKVKTSLMAIYLGPVMGATSFNRVGSNCESATVNMNPTTTEYADITMDVKQTDLDSYKVSVEASGKFDKDDPAYDLFYQLYLQQAVLDDAKRPLLIVHRFDNNRAQLYKDATVSINNFTLTGAESLEVDFAISANSSPVNGYATLSQGDNYKTATFTETEEYINITPSTVTVTAGDTTGVTVTAATNPTSATVTWASSDDNIATVTNGKIIGVAQGACTVTGSFTGTGGGTISDTVAVTVVAAD